MSSRVLMYIYEYILVFFRNVFHYLFYTALKDSAEHIDCMSADTLVAFQTGNLPGANMIKMDQSILRYVFFCAWFPIIVDTKSCAHSSIFWKLMIC